MMAHEDALNHCRTALAHIDSYMARICGMSWADWVKTDQPQDPMLLLKQSRDELGAYISRIARVDELADVVVTFDGVRLPVQVEWEDGKPYPSHANINGTWVDVTSSWLSFVGVWTRFTATVQTAMRQQAKIDATP
jgi:hypothetical protein